MRISLTGVPDRTYIDPSMPQPSTDNETLLNDHLGNFRGVFDVYQAHDEA